MAQLQEIDALLGVVARYYDTTVGLGYKISDWWAMAREPWERCKVIAQQLSEAEGIEVDIYKRIYHLYGTCICVGIYQAETAAYWQMVPGFEALDMPQMVCRTSKELTAFIEAVAGNYGNRMLAENQIKFDI